ncbi:MAG: AarF/ABC1/UbiB kinase family protein [Planctomycetes bacterium]|nr:AarF/ABC1/UbiB kinase family protein [Planctomycetota bacterium]
MSITGIYKTPRRLRRLTQIAQVLIRHGFGHLVHQLNLQSFVPLPKRVREPSAPPEGFEEDDTLARRLVRVMEELGPTFVKLGQLLSTRPDIVPEDLARELRRLQDKVRPFDAKAAVEIVERELSAPIRENFAEFEETATASGSLGQVHKARLIDGTDVVVKVKRPGIERTIFSDIDLLMMVAKRAEGVPDLAIFRPVMLTEEFGRCMRRELDFVTEASSTSRFYEHFGEKDSVRIPKVYWEYTTSSVLTLERIDGVSISGPDRVREMGSDPKEVVDRITSMFMEQFFTLGLFHADPHPGNLLIDEKGRIGIIDFGLVGHLDSELKGQLATMFIALSRRNFEVVVDIFADMGLITDDTSFSELQSELAELFETFYGIPVQKIDMRDAFSRVMSIVRRHGIVLPRDLVLLGRSFVTVTGLAQMLDPNFNLADAARPHAAALIRERLSPTQVAKSVGMSLWHLSNLASQLPRDLRRLTKQVLRGNLQLAFRHEGLQDLIRELDRTGNRVTLGIILAAMIVGSSLIIANKIQISEISTLGAAGFFFAAVLGAWLVLAILRSGRI